MLNEHLEVEAYLCDIEHEDNPRILPKLLTDEYKVKLNGIQDVLTLIAREFIFGFMGAEEITPELHEDFISVLRLWFGFDDENDLNELRKGKTIKKWLKNHPHADGYFKNYFDKFISPKAEWDDFVKTFHTRFLNKRGYLYTSKEVCYENIIADALADGPLKNYYLIFRGDDTRFNTSLQSPNGKGLTTPTYQKNYKLLATNLLAMKRADGVKTVYIRKLRLLNWLGYDSDKWTNWFPGLKWEKQAICKRISGDDYVKLQINNEFVQKFDLKIIEKTELKDYQKKEYTILKDCGHNKYLEKIN